MSDRTALLSRATRIVVKVGTNVISDAETGLDHGVIESLARQIARLNDGGTQVVLVSSGAIGAGAAALDMKSRPRTLPGLQAAASIGQSKLIGLYDQCLVPLGYHAAQILLTRADFEDRDRYLNACNTINALFELKSVPIINENDAVSVDEIKFGDNDILSAFVTHMIKADLLVLLTSAEGLYRCSRSREVIPWVAEVTEEIMRLVDGSKTAMGSGGMASKLEAVQVVIAAGEPVVIAGGRVEDVLLRIMRGEAVGTLFAPGERNMRGYKRWIGFTARSRGKVVVDAGAEQVLKHRGVSLLPVGVTEVKGEFSQGDIVTVLSPSGEPIARGQTNYSADELRRIKGLRSSEIEKVLSQKAYDEVIHYNNMVVLKS